ncbi:hypothetical protein NJB1907f44_48880 [Mycobacterium marinum]|nr:hypothetical protein [Mycobacterium marinum]RFZ30707.1 hypothetical protein KST_05023 [Mycobacterium marinum]GJN99095.1 hypothetical protein NJB1907E8_50230 [Mycobacterium marinum]GJO06008.1 hypothetical protein NJB1907E90_16670 [Mycobacterium marinum]GJO10670.1 hypothetical protein NJB1808e29_46690 [Mycobacterium marinum]GJO14466.1 hypothetical protein NJB1907f34b_50890 [Mycobacterium marinum]
MTTTTPTSPSPDIELPAGAAFGDKWEGSPPERLILGPTRGITDSDVVVWASAVQRADASIENGIDTPAIQIDGSTDALNSDQARELAAALLQAADEIDGWTR